MSADYWCSSQRNQWQLTRFSLLEARRKVLLLERKMIQNGLIKDYPNIVYDYNMRIYLHNLLLKLGRRLNVRQVAVATAEIYLTRFLTRNSLKEINVYLFITTCLYVSCKIEECPQHIRFILSEARNIWPEYIPHDVTKLAEFEFYLIEEMDSYLLLHHPYKSLIQLRNYLDSKFDVYGFKLTDEEMQNSWSLINDSYVTDLHLLVPPHIIAVAAIYITIVLKKNLAQTRNKNTPNGNASKPPETRSSEIDVALGNSRSESGNVNGNFSRGDGAYTGGEMGLESKEMNIVELMNLPQTKQSSESKNASQQLQSTQQQSQKTKESDLINFDLDIVDEDTIKIHKFMNFLEHSHINLDEVVEAVQDMINAYVLWNRYNEQGVKKALQSMLLRRQ
ncbi:SSN8 [Candida oxycetoniae]|uniref:RNA polymerase II holoenzyme cyclin-like subunit n=1 Tax=Candida oxycetoniae TaxID=497107 RepID=A0AAI9WZB9_9ASCO|nr:SSN8 [Candida oxycetoniae]KAI3406251.2 SSN8 [Candida oxycetoniae]